MDNPCHLFRANRILSAKDGINIRFIEKQISFAVDLSDIYRRALEKIRKEMLKK